MGIRNTIRKAIHPADHLPPMCLEHVLECIASAVSAGNDEALALLELALTRFGAEITTH